VALATDKRTWKALAVIVAAIATPLILIVLMLSYISMNRENWQQHSYVALCGVAEHAMLKRLEVEWDIFEVCLCLDNDEAGQLATERLTARLNELGGYDVERLCPKRKDWNDDLKAEAMRNFELDQRGGMCLAL